MLISKFVTFINALNLHHVQQTSICEAPFSSKRLFQPSASINTKNKRCSKLEIWKKNRNCMLLQQTTNILDEDVRTSVSKCSHQFQYTNPSIIAELDYKVAEKEENFWWSGTIPTLDMDIGTSDEEDLTSEQLLEEKKRKMLLEHEHREFIEDLIGKDFVKHISNLIQSRSNAREEGKYDVADEIKRDIQMLSHDSDHLNTPVDNDFLQRKNIDSVRFDEGREKISTVSQFTLPHGYQIDIKDLPRRCGGGSMWRLSRSKSLPNNHISELDSNKTNEGILEDNVDNRTILQLAHTALGMVAFASEKNKNIEENDFQKLIHQVEIRLTQNTNVLNELRGRKASDAAFWFALSGVTSPLIFRNLVEISCYELKRFGKRSSCRAKDILHVVERVAAAGCLSSPIQERDSTLDVESSEFVNHLYHVAAECLEFKMSDNSELTHQEMVDSISSLTGGFSLHSAHPLLWIWRFSTKQRKQKAFLREASRHWETQSMKSEDVTYDAQFSFDFDWKMYEDPTRPLVVDIGCGMGVSLLGLASLGSEYDRSKMKTDIDLDWSKCNFLGGDLSRLAIGYANGISKRWAITDKLLFCVASAEDMIQEVCRSYPGEVKLVMIQFPTPFRLQQTSVQQGHESEDMEKIMFDNIEKKTEISTEVQHKEITRVGNSQLPSDAKSGFMVTERLLEMTHSVLKKYNGKLLIQSNCEDVAIEIQKMAIQSVGFQTNYVSQSMVLNGNNDVQITKRTEDWIKLYDGKVDRAEGPSWSASSLLPHKGATETEIACTLNRTPIHRCLLTIPQETESKFCEQ